MRSSLFSLAYLLGLDTDLIQCLYFSVHYKKGKRGTHSFANTKSISRKTGGQLEAGIMLIVIKEEEEMGRVKRERILGPRRTELLFSPTAIYLPTNLCLWTLSKPGITPPFNNIL